MLRERVSVGSGFAVDGLFCMMLDPRALAAVGLDRCERGKVRLLPGTRYLFDRLPHALLSLIQALIEVEHAGLRSEEPPGG